MSQVIRIGSSLDEGGRPEELLVSHVQHVGDEGARRGLAQLPGGHFIEVYNHPENGQLWYEQMSLEDWKASQEGTVALQEWHIRARVRIRETTVRRSVDPWRERTFQKGQELEMLQWGRAGQPVNRSDWWTSYDIDGAYIIDAALVEVLSVLDELSPFHRQGEEVN